MTENDNAAYRHTSAAINHTHASQFQGSASRHYETGKDWAHAAHHALLARGHSLRAIKDADAAHAYYAPHHLSGLTKSSEPDDGTATWLPEGSDTHGLSAAEHYAAAGVHHAKAAHHHEEAAGLYGEEKYAAAAHEAQMAHRHARYSVFHDDEAAMHYSEHYGRSGQSAEIA